MTAYPNDDLSPVEPVEFVKEFQRRAGIEVDGVPGPQTWAALGSEPVHVTHVSVTLSDAEEWAAKMKQAADEIRRRQSWTRRWRSVW